MNTYFRSIVITVAISHLLLLLTGELGGEHSRRVLRYLYGLILLLTLVAPIYTCVQNVSELIDHVCSLLSSEEALVLEPEKAAIDSTYQYVAERIASTIAETYEIDREDIRITIQTTDDNTIQQIEIGIHNCYYALRQDIEEALQKTTDIPLIVKGW